MARTKNVLFVGGRLLLGGFFLQNAMNHFTNTDTMTQYAASKDVPAPRSAVLGAGALLATAGVSLITGYRPRLGIAAAATFFTGVSPKMHDFWKIEDESQRMSEMVNFSKNIALLGAVAALTAVEEPWPISIKSRQARRERRTAEERLEEAAEMGHS